MFDKSAAGAEFEKVIRQAWKRTQMRLVSISLMANQLASRGLAESRWTVERMVQWLTVGPQWLTVTHVRCWHAHHPTEGPARYTKADSSRFRFRKTMTTSPLAVTPSGMKSNLITCMLLPSYEMREVVKKYHDRLREDEKWKSNDPFKGLDGSPNLAF